MKLSPAILTDSFATVQEQVNAVRQSSLIEAVQIDIIDGAFVDNLTVTPIDLTVGEYDPLKLDFHLMVEEPMDFVFECEGVANYLPIRRIIGQVERMSYQSDFLQEIAAQGWEGALALDLFTPLEAIDTNVWPNLRHILLMAVEAGYQNQSFHPQVLDKIRELRQMFPDPQQLNIMVDGGIKLENAAQVIQAGANEINVGSAIWKSDDPLRMIEAFFHLRYD